MKTEVHTLTKYHVFHLTRRFLPIAREIAKRPSFPGEYDGRLDGGQIAPLAQKIRCNY